MMQTITWQTFFNALLKLNPSFAKEVNKINANTKTQLVDGALASDLSKYALHGEVKKITNNFLAKGGAMKKAVANFKRCHLPSTRPEDYGVAAEKLARKVVEAFPGAVVFLIPSFASGMFPPPSRMALMGPMLRPGVSGSHIADKFLVMLPRDLSNSVISTDVHNVIADRSLGKGAQGEFFVTAGRCATPFVLDTHHWPKGTVAINIPMRGNGSFNGEPIRGIKVFGNFNAYLQSDGHVGSGGGVINPPAAPPLSDRSVPDNPNFDPNPPNNTVIDTGGLGGGGVSPGFPTSAGFPFGLSKKELLLMGGGFAALLLVFALKN